MPSNWNGRKKERPMPMGNPADYPLGSLESRAAARAMLEAMKPERSQLEDDALALYSALKWYLKPPNWNCVCDQRVIAIYSIATSIRELEDDDDESAGENRDFRIAELCTDATEDVLTWDRLLAIWKHVSGLKNQKAREAWARRCDGIPYPKSAEESERDGIENARLFWESLERFATGAAGKFKGYSEWKPDLCAVQLNRSTRRLLPVYDNATAQ